MPSTDATAYDVFISYSRKDNMPILEAYPQGWVTAIRDHILADHRQFSTAPLRIFFDTDEIRDADDWRFRILGALRHSKMLLVCLSPGYFASEYCRWEWEEYIKRQVHQLMGSESVASVYFIEVPGSDEQATAQWCTEIKRGNYTDLRPWFPEGAEALQKAEVRSRMAALGGSLWERLQRARRAMAVPGNLRWQNPHFVGRREELRRLHESLGTGAVGVVTAVQGLGGQGKTELAVAYAHGWADSYPAGLWSLAAEGKTELLPLIGELAWDRALGFTPSEAEKNDPVLLGRGVLDHLKARATSAAASDPDGGAACLLLLDNVSESELLSPAQLTTLPGGMGTGWLRLLATTRLEVRAQKDRLTIIAVDALDEDSALTLIRDHQPPRDAQRRIVDDLEKGEPDFADATQEAAAREIVRALGGFTLAVEQVALYLGLHPEVTPADFFATLQQRGLPVADEVVLHEEGAVAAQMLTQSKQLGLILDATLAKLTAPARTALDFAALLPPDSVPWPWLRALTVAQHPELGEKDSLGADPWLSLQRRLTGLRLLTPGDQPQIARIHRLVAAHLAGSASHLSRVTHQHVGTRAFAMEADSRPPEEWELTALLLTIPPFLAGGSPSEHVAGGAINLSDKVRSYRSLAEAASLIHTAVSVYQRLAASDPTNAEWQCDLSVSLNKLGDLAVAQGDLPAASRSFSESKVIAERLAASDPANAAWQRDLAVSLSKLGEFAAAQGDLAAAMRSFSESKTIAERLAASDPANAAWQRDLSVSLIKLGELAVAQGDLAAASRSFSESKAIRQRLAASDPANAAWQRDLSVLLDRLGDLAVAQGDLAGALRCFSESKAIRQRLVASDPVNAAWQNDLSVSLKKLGELAVAQGDLAAALRSFSESKDIAEHLAASDPANAAWQFDLGISNERLGDLAVAQGKLDEALVYHTARKAIIARLAASDPANAAWQRDLSVSLNKLGELAVAQGDLAAAARSFSEGKTIIARLAASDPANAAWQFDLGISNERLGDLAVAQGKLDEALVFHTARKAIIARLSASDPANAAWQRDLAVSHFKLYQFAKAKGDAAMVEAELRACFTVLDAMKQRSLHMDPQMANVYEQLAGMFGS